MGKCTKKNNNRGDGGRKVSVWGLSGCTGLTQSHPTFAPFRQPCTRCAPQEEPIRFSYTTPPPSSPPAALPLHNALGGVEDLGAETVQKVPRRQQPAHRPDPPAGAVVEPGVNPPQLRDGLPAQHPRRHRPLHGRRVLGGHHPPAGGGAPARGVAAATLAATAAATHTPNRTQRRQLRPHRRPRGRLGGGVRHHRQGVPPPVPRGGGGNSRSPGAVGTVGKARVVARQVVARLQSPRRNSVEVRRGGRVPPALWGGGGSDSRRGRRSSTTGGDGQMTLGTRRRRLRGCPAGEAPADSHHQEGAHG